MIYQNKIKLTFEPEVHRILHASQRLGAIRQIIIHNLNGKLVKEFSITNETTSVNWKINTAQNGIYIYSLIIDEKKYTTKKLVVIK